jgi:hypothetical protein
LEWDGAPEFSRTGYEPPGNQPPGDLRWWRDRRVLPTAEFVADADQKKPAPAPERPREERPREERPREGRPREGRPREERPRGSPPRGERPRGEKGRRDKPFEARAPRPAYAPGRAVACVLLEEKTKAGNWKAVIKGTDIKGDVVGTAPGDAAPGQEVSLVLRFYTPPKTASFFWPSSVPQATPAKGPTRPPEE